MANKAPRARSAGLALALLGLVGCGTETIVPLTPVPTTVDLSTTTVQFSALGDTARVSVTVLDQDGSALETPVSWSSADATVATVSAGLVTAVGPGQATVSATAGGASAEVTVAVEQVVDSATATPTAVTLLFPGDTTRLSLAAFDSNGNAVGGHASGWVSSDTSVATVDEDGLVTGISAGTASVEPSPAFGQSVSVTVLEALGISTDSLRHAVAGEAFSDTLEAVGGSGAYGWSVLSGMVPTGIALDTLTGEVSGTASMAGTTSVEYEVSDSLGQQASRTLPFVVQPPPILGADERCSDHSDLAVISFTDALVDSLVHEALGAPQGSEITCGAASTVNNLRIYGAGDASRSLSGLQNLAGLDTLWLGFDTIQDLAPVAELAELDILLIRDTPVASLDPLAPLTQLRALFLQTTETASLSGMEALTSLTRFRTRLNG